MVLEQLAKTNAELEKKLIERNNEKNTLNRDLQKMTEDRDYWKSEFEKLTKTCNPTDSDFAEKIRTWITNRMMSSMCNIIEIRKKKDNIDSIIEDRYLSMDLLTKTITAKVESEILKELGDIMLQSSILD